MCLKSLSRRARSAGGFIEAQRNTLPSSTPSFLHTKPNSQLSPRLSNRSAVWRRVVLSMCEFLLVRSRRLWEGGLRRPGHHVSHLVVDAVFREEGRHLPIGVEEGPVEAVEEGLVPVVLD